MQKQTRNRIIVVAAVVVILALVAAHLGGTLSGMIARHLSGAGL